MSAAAPTPAWPTMTTVAVGSGSPVWASMTCPAMVPVWARGAGAGDHRQQDGERPPRGASDNGSHGGALVGRAECDIDPAAVARAVRGGSPECTCVPGRHHRSITERRGRTGRIVVRAPRTVAGGPFAVAAPPRTVCQTPSAVSPRVPEVRASRSTRGPSNATPLGAEPLLHDRRGLEVEPPRERPLPVHDAVAGDGPRGPPPRPRTARPPSAPTPDGPRAPPDAEVPGHVPVGRDAARRDLADDGPDALEEVLAGFGHGAETGRGGR